MRRGVLAIEAGAELPSGTAVPDVRPSDPVVSSVSWGRSGRLLLCGMLVLAFALRTVWALRYAPPLSFFGDDTFFYAAGRQLAHGQGYVTPLAGHMSVATAEHPPLFPFALAGLSKIGVASVNAQRMFNVVAGTVTVLLVALLARRVAGRRPAMIAAGLCAVYPVFIGADGSLMSETLFGTLVAGTLLQALRWYDSPTLVRAGVLGMLIGLATLTRSEGLLLLPLLVGPLVIRLRVQGLRLALVAGLGCAVVLAPWVVRNAIALGRPLLSDNQGITVAGSNCRSTYYGSQIGNFDFSCVATAIRGLPLRDSEAVTSSHAQSVGLRYAQNHPARAVLVAGTRLAGVWGLFAPGRQVVVTGRRVGMQKVGIAMYYVMLILGAIGAVGIWRSRRRYALSAGHALHRDQCDRRAHLLARAAPRGSRRKPRRVRSAGAVALTRALETRRR